MCVLILVHLLTFFLTILTFKSPEEKMGRGYQHFLIPLKCFLLCERQIQLLNPFPNKPWLLHVCSTSLLKKTVGKVEIARHKQFLLFLHCFLPVKEELSAIFFKFEIVVCKLFQFGRV